MSHEPLNSEDVIARQHPEAQAIIRILLTKIAELEARLNKSPRNSSLPPAPSIRTPNPLRGKNAGAVPAVCAASRRDVHASVFTTDSGASVL